LATKTEEVTAPAPASERPGLAVVKPIRAPAAVGLPGSPDLDLEQFEDAADHDPAMERELIDLYLADTPKLLASLRAAIADRAAALTQRHAHTLKGGSRTIGAMALGELAEEMERTAEADDFASAQAALEVAEAAFVRVAESMTGRRLRTAA
jgi:HPt (histidine-containing phosphotransfer) domain-containing protein